MLIIIIIAIFKANDEDLQVTGLIIAKMRKDNVMFESKRKRKLCAVDVKITEVGLLAVKIIFCYQTFLQGSTRKFRAQKFNLFFYLMTALQVEILHWTAYNHLHIIM